MSTNFFRKYHIESDVADRPRSDLDLVLGHQFPVLDYGFVRVVVLSKEGSFLK